MNRQQRQRIVIVLIAGLALFVLARHVIKRSGFSAPGGGERTAFAAVATELSDEAGTTILRSVRAYLENGTAIALAENPGAGDGADRAVVISLSRPARPALVAQGRGPSLRDALADAAEEISRAASAAEVRDGRLKVDVAIWRGELERLDAERKARVDRSLEGLWLPEPDLLLLPEELLSRRLVTSRRKLHRQRLRDHLEATGRQRPEKSPARDGDPYHVVRFDSFMEGDDGSLVRLYRGNDRSPSLSASSLLAAARLGGEYLLRHQRDDGSYDYLYEAKQDTYSDDYNLLRHAGTTYSLVELYQATDDARFLDAARRALDYLLTHHVSGPKPEDAAADFDAILSPDEEAKLGGAALAVLAIVQYQNASGDARWQPNAERLARFMRFQQKDDGEFHSKYYYGEPPAEPHVSLYYPGEAILSLLRLHALTGEPRWLDTARRAADWLIDVRDAGKGVGEVPHDHWLTMSLNELHAATGDDRYARHAEVIAHTILATQRKDEAEPDLIGAYKAARSTPTATRSEAMVAMYRLTRRRGLDPDPYLEALLLAAAYQLRCQLTEENVLYVPRPDLALGGFRNSLINWAVRIDYVQHNVSSLLGLRSILLDAQKPQGV